MSGCIPDSDTCDEQRKPDNSSCVSYGEKYEGVQKIIKNGYGFVHGEFARNLIMIRKVALITYGSFFRAATALALAFMMIVAAKPFASASPATDAINAFHEKLLMTMQNSGNWDYHQRYTYLLPAVEKTFNVAVMMQLASSTHWRIFTDEEKLQLVKAFTEFTVANYASRFNGYSGQSFVTVGERSDKNGRVLVQTRLERTKAAPIAIDYMLSPNKDGTFKVIDVFLDGKYSELSMRRSEFSPTLRDHGFAGLLSLLQNKVNHLELDAVP